MHYQHEENLSAKVNDMLEYIIPENEKGNIMILAVKRLGSSPHPLVKVATNVHTRSLILEMKGKLTIRTPGYTSGSLLDHHRPWNTASY